MESLRNRIFEPMTQITKTLGIVEALGVSLGAKHWKYTDFPTFLSESLRNRIFEPMTQITKTLGFVEALGVSLGGKHWKYTDFQCFFGH